MNRKLMLIVGIAVAVLIIVGAIVLAFSGSGDKKQTVIPRIETYPDLTMSLQTENPVMVNDGQTLYWPIVNNGTEVMLVYSVTALVIWSDDEEPPSWRITYVNEPDTFTAFVEFINPTANVTSNAQASSYTGTLSAMLNVPGSPGIVFGNGASNWTFPESGQTDIGMNDSFYLSVGCVAGHIESTTPGHILRYTDRGDEVTIQVTLKYKLVPQDVFEYWFIGEGKGM